jgi:hypothetical protein
MRYELGFYITEDVLHSYRRENLKSTALTTRHPSIHKSWHYPSTSDGRSVGIVRMRTKGHATEFVLFL